MDKMTSYMYSQVGTRYVCMYVQHINKSNWQKRSFFQLIFCSFEFSPSS